MQEYQDKTEERDRSFEEGRDIGRKTMAYSVASLVLSMMSLVCCCTGVISLAFGVAAIVFAVFSRRHLGYFDAMALIGLVVGIVGSVFGGFVFAADLLSFTTPFEGIEIPSGFEEFGQEF